MTNTVYAVIGGVDYEGEVFDTLRLFDCRSTAEAYADHLRDEFGVDYVLIQTRDVCMESALATA